MKFRELSLFISLGAYFVAPGLGSLCQRGRGFDKLSHRRQAQQVVEFIETTVPKGTSTFNPGTMINRINFINFHQPDKLSEYSLESIGFKKV